MDLIDLVDRIERMEPVYRLELVKNDLKPGNLAFIQPTKRRMTI